MVGNRARIGAACVRFGAVNCGLLRRESPLYADSVDQWGRGLPPPLDHARSNATLYRRAQFSIDSGVIGNRDSAAAWSTSVLMTSGLSKTEL